MSKLGHRRFEHSSDDLDLVDDLAESRKLVAFDPLIEDLLACARIEHPVVIEVIVVVHVVIPQHRMPAGDPCGIPIPHPAHLRLERRAHVSAIEVFVHFQDDAAPTVHVTKKMHAAGGRVLGKLERMRLGMVYELVTSEALLVDGLVSIPRVPVVGVSSFWDRRSFRDRRM